MKCFWARESAMPDSLPRIDARDDQQRRIATHLRAEHLPGVDTDDDASVTLEIEQARLALLACGGTLAFEVTQMLGTKRVLCVTPLYWSIAILLVAFAASWAALIWSERIRRWRVDRRFTIYYSALQDYVGIGSSEGLRHDKENAAWKAQVSTEASRRTWLRRFRFLVALAVAAGVGAGLLAAVGTVDLKRCHYEKLRPQPEIK